MSAFGVTERTVIFVKIREPFFCTKARCSRTVRGHDAYALAAARLNAIGSEDYETLRIKEVLTSEIPLHDLLKSIASAVLIRLDGSVGLRLKNGQTIERSKIS